MSAIGSDSRHPIASRYAMQPGNYRMDKHKYLRIGNIFRRRCRRRLLKNQTQARKTKKLKTPWDLRPVKTSRIAANAFLTRRLWVFAAFRRIEMWTRVIHVLNLSPRALSVCYETKKDHTVSCHVGRLSNISLGGYRRQLDRQQASPFLNGAVAVEQENTIGKIQGDSIIRPLALRCCDSIRCSVGNECLSQTSESNKTHWEENTPSASGLLAIAA